MNVPIKRGQRGIALSADNDKVQPKVKNRLETKDLNRIKVVLVEKKRTNKWLAEELKKDPATVSKWCTNSNQPDLATLFEIARVLDVDVRELINKSKE